MTENFDPTTFDINRLRDDGREATAAAEFVVDTPELESNDTPELVVITPEVKTGPEQIPAIILHRGSVLEGVREETAQAA